MTRLNVEFDVSHQLAGGDIDYALHVENLDRPVATGVFTLRDLTHDLMTCYTLANGELELDGMRELHYLKEVLEDELSFVSDLIAKHTKHKE
jgi:hypothetical protein